MCGGGETQHATIHHQTCSRYEPYCNVITDNHLHTRHCRAESTGYTNDCTVIGQTLGSVHALQLSRNCQSVEYLVNISALAMGQIQNMYRRVQKGAVVKVVL